MRPPYNSHTYHPSNIFVWEHTCHLGIFLLVPAWPLLGGAWVLADPAKRWAARRDPAPAPLPDGTPAPPHPFGYATPSQAWRHRLVSALDCPYCIGTQATLAIAAVLAATSPGTRPGRLARTACAALAASYLVGHVSYRLDTAPAPAPAPAATATATAKDAK